MKLKSGVSLTERQDMDYLAAVNYVLNQIGSPGLPFIQPDGFALPEQIAAEARLAEASTWVQKRGWWFNTEMSVALVPDPTTGLLTLPLNTLKILNSGAGFIIDRNGLAYDPARQSTDFSAFTTVTVDLIREQEWTNLPATVQDVVRIAAAQEMITIELEDMRKADALVAKYQEAYVEMKKDDLEVKKRSKLYNPAFVYTRSGARPYTGGSLFPSGNNQGR